MAKLSAWDSKVLRKEKVGPYIITLTRNKSELYRLLVRSDRFDSYRLLKQWKGKKQRKKAEESFTLLLNHLREKHNQKGENQ